MKQSMGELFFSAQYQQEPIPLAGNIIKAEWFKEYDVAPTCSYADLLVISIDTAMKGEQLSDFSVATVWLSRGDNCYLLDLWRQRVDYPDLRYAVLAASREVPQRHSSDRRQGVRDQPDSGPKSEKHRGYRHQPRRRQADTRRQDLGEVRSRRGVLSQSTRHGLVP